MDFTASYQDARGQTRQVDLVKLSCLGLRRHAKIRSKAHPFDPEYSEYFRERWLSKCRRRSGRKPLAYA